MSSIRDAGRVLIRYTSETGSRITEILVFGDNEQVPSSKPPFKNKTALVTGAASGMGLATAQAFAEADAAVALADFSGTPCEAEAKKLADAGHKAIAIRCDVSDAAQVAARATSPFLSLAGGCRIRQDRRNRPHRPTADSTPEDRDLSGST